MNVNFCLLFYCLFLFSELIIAEYTILLILTQIPICLHGPLGTEKHLWRITSAAIAVAMVTGITRCM